MTKQNQHDPSSATEQPATEPSADLTQLQQQVEQLQQEVSQAKEGQLRSQADYHNLVRRTQEEKARFFQMATREFAESLLQPLDHLGLAAEQLNDPGLSMVLKQLWQTLNDQGLEEIPVMGKSFDSSVMEVVDKKGNGETVVSVIKKGYRLNGDVIQHAKVIVE